MALTEDSVRSTLKSLLDPVLDKDYVSAKEVKAVRVSGGAVEVELVLGYPAKSLFDSI
ncbi:MAG: iron-sulfur cluster assembly protein, partial [Betaproteobacteria bacterium]|nr:iron-sulfur cluster assembly protein [Betaproteobacteria bacterium]